MPLYSQQQVGLGDRSYQISIGTELLNSPKLFEPAIHGQVVIVTNQTVAPLYLRCLSDALSRWKPLHIELHDGEQYKSLTTLEQIFDRLIAMKIDRSATLVALGGGVVGDITGLAAALYQRGIALIQVPTTLLAQVDSSVGGKTAVNHPLAKNMIGAFYQPNAVIADLNTLNTLPEREFRAGIAEIIKYGLIRDAEFFGWLEEHLDALLERSPSPLAYAVAHSCMHKAEVVAADEREQGQRALLNLGHTFGHAIEAATHYASWLHGEAVACGLAMAADLSVMTGRLAPDAAIRIRNLLMRAELPVIPPPMVDAKQLLQLMRSDKKVQHGTQRLVLLEQIGTATVTADYPTKMLKEMLEQYCRRAA